MKGDNLPAQIRIGGKIIGEGSPVFYIAEAGSNHDGKLSQAKELIDAAVEAGADAVKFQLFKAENFYPTDHPAFAVMKAAELPRQWLPDLDRHARKRKIPFLATPFDREAVDLLDSMDAPALKWASSETTNLPLLKYAVSKGRPLLMSTGMCTLADVDEAVEVAREGDCPIILLHCISEYPTPSDRVHLRVMTTLRQSFELPVGFSDHTTSPATPAIAVALGACVIEKHFTLSRKLKGPDHSYALEPHELKQSVGYVREAEKVLGSPLKRLMPDEIKYGRRDGLYAARPVAKGATISAEDLTLARPALGLRARYRSAALGARASRAIAKGAAIHWKDLN